MASIHDIQQAITLLCWQSHFLAGSHAIQQTIMLLGRLSLYLTSIYTIWPEVTLSAML